MADARLEEGLVASVGIFDLVKEVLETANGTEAAVSIAVADLRRIKKIAVKMNHTITRMHREGKEREDRLWIEMHLMHETLRGESTDIEANRVRVIELFRKLRYDGDRDRAERDRDRVPATSLTINPLTQASASSQAVDRAILNVRLIQQTIDELDPEGNTNTHGAALISAVQHSV